MNYNQIPPKGPTPPPPPPDEWYEQQQPVSPDYGQPIDNKKKPEKPRLQDAWDTSRDEDKTDEKRQYITTHTPHAWLDRYIEYSRELSPRAFDMLHEAAGLWALSSAVAGRVQIFSGGRLRHTSLMIAAVARSSVWAKSHTISLAEKVLEDAGLAWRLLPTKASPQAIIEEMSDDKRVVAILRQLDDSPDADEKEIKALEGKLAAIQKELGMLYAHEGQRAWHISEFGSKIIAGMMRPGSVQADFSDFLRDVNEKVGKEYVYRTRGHGKEIIKSPYLAIIADTTPADMRPYAKVGAPLWSNGFFPRFAIIAPTEKEVPSKARVALKYTRQPAAPAELTTVLANLNQRLGRRDNYHQKLVKTPIEYGHKVWDAIYNYEAWIDQNRLETEDLDGTYARLVHEQSVAIAMLLAVTDGFEEIQMHHYQRAIEVCERIRDCTESFYERMTENPITEKQAAQSQLEDRIIKIIRTHHAKTGEWPTVNNIRLRTGSGKRGRLSREDIIRVMDVLRNANQLEEFKEKGKRACRYRLIT